MKRKRLGTKKGFTLIEMLISIMIFMSVMAIVYLLFWKSREQMDRSQMLAEASTNARVALDTLSMDLRQLGFHCDDNTEGYLGDMRLTDSDIIRQPGFVYGDPYQVVFNADLDTHLAESAQLGPLAVEAGGTVFPQGVGSGFELYFVYSDPSHAIGKTCVLGRDYGGSVEGVGLEGNVGAETIRYTLDVPPTYNGETISGADGLVTIADKEDIFWDSANQPENKTPNPFDYILFKQWAGQDENGNNVWNMVPIAYGIRAWSAPQDDYVNAMQIATSYTDTNPKPAPLFQYWGHFFKNSPSVDPTDPTQVSPDDEPLDLWGDWGHDTNPTNEDDDHEGDGELCPIEINNLYRSMYGLTSLKYHIVGTNPRPSAPNPLTYDEKPASGSWDPRANDYNGNGLYDLMLDDVIGRIIVSVTAETRERDAKLNNPRVLNFDTDSGTMTQITDYKYHDTVLTTTIFPRNLSNPEGRFDITEPSDTTRTPVPALTDTATPVPSNTETPILSPTSTHTVTPTITPTFTAVSCPSGYHNLFIDSEMDFFPDLIRIDDLDNPSVPVTNLAGLKEFRLQENNFDVCLDGLSDHFVIRVRSYDNLATLPVPSPDDLPVDNAWPGFTHNVDWKLDIYWDGEETSPYYQQVIAVMTDFNLDPDGVVLDAVDFNNVDLLAIPGYVVSSGGYYGRNHSLQGALIYLDSDASDGFADYLLVEINAHDSQEDRLGSHRPCQGCYEAVDDGNGSLTVNYNACRGAIPYVSITDPDHNDPADTCSGCSHGFEAHYSGTATPAALHADFFLNNASSGTLGRPLDVFMNFTSDAGPYIESYGFTNEYIVGTDLTNVGYYCKVHDVEVISISTETATPTVSPTPTITPTFSPTSTPPCPWPAPQIVQVSALYLPAQLAIEFTFQNTTGMDVVFNYWNFTQNINPFNPTRQLSKIEFKSGASAYSIKWIGNSSPVAPIYWTTPGTALAADANFKVKIYFNAWFSAPQTLYYVLGPLCEQNWIGVRNITMPF